MKILRIFIILFVCLLPLKAIEPLSDQANIYHLTCTPGEDLYSIFGHSAIRVQDPAQGIDLVFNYGTFDFMTPNFYLKFMNGQLDYMLSVSRFSSFLSSYRDDHRGVQAYLLNLSQPEKQQVWDFLRWNMEPENRKYRYDFFFDNCATRIRDLYFRIKGIEAADFELQGNHSYRDYLHQYLQKSPWTAQGIDLIIGIKADAKASPYSRAFLPDYLDSLFLHPSANELFLKKEQILDDSVTDTESTGISPFMASTLLLLFFLFISMVELKMKRKFLIFDRFLLLITGLCGLLIGYLWFFTDHQVTVWTFNLLWAMPSNFVLLFVLDNKRKSVWLRWWIRITFLLSSMVFCFGYFFMQNFPSLVYPMALTLMVRLCYYCHWRFIFRQQTIA